MGMRDRDIQLDPSSRRLNQTVQGLDPLAQRPEFKATELVDKSADVESALAMLLSPEGQEAAAPTAAPVAKAGGAAPRSQGNAAIPGLGLEQLPQSGDSDADGQVKGLRGLRGELDAAQKALTGRADAPTTSAETIGQLLVGLLPGLLGLGIGGAVGGTTGALAGAGGGFGGSAEGLNLMNKNKREDRAKLVDRSEKLQARMDDLEKQIGLRKDRLEDRDLSKTEAAKQRNQLKEIQNQQDKVAAEIEARRQKFTAGENSKDRWLQAKMKSEELGQREAESSREYLAHMAAAGAKAAGDAGNRKEAELYTQASTAADMLNKLEAGVKEFGNAESNLNISPFSDPKGAADLESAIENFAIAYAKIVDPESVVRPQEVENAKKMIPMGWFTSNKTTMRGIQLMREILTQKMSERREHFGQHVPDKAAQGGQTQSGAWSKGHTGAAPATSTSNSADLWSKGKPDAN